MASADRSPPDPGLGTRLWFAWACFFRVLFDGSFAGRAWAVREAMPEPPRLPGRKTDDEDLPRPSMEAPRAAEERQKKAKAAARAAAAELAAAREAGALSLLALLQREGRLVDFLQQDVASFSDEDIGAAARVVHAGCRKALRDHATVDPLRTEDEGAKVEVPEGYEPAGVKLVGDVKGSPPFRGTLRHKGWRATTLKLPEPVAGHDVRVLAPAEVEL